MERRKKGIVKLTAFLFLLAASIYKLVNNSMTDE